MDDLHPSTSAPRGPVGAPAPVYTEIGLIMDGLHARRHVQEPLVGRDVSPSEGLRVLPATRYRSDAWAKDESGGRIGTIVKVQKNEISGGISCIVRWDRVDGRPWGKEADRNLSMAYCGIYSCGSRGHFHLAVDANQPIPEPIKPTSKKVQDADIQTVSENFWENEKENTVIQEMEAISARSRALQRDLELLKERTNDQLFLFTDMCESNLSEAETILDIPSTGVSDEDLGLKKEEAKKKKNSDSDDNNVKEQKALDAEINRLWAAVESAQTAYKKKLQADEMANKMMDQLQEILLPPFFIYCAAEITEMARKFNKFALAGTTDQDGRGLTSELEKAGLYDRRQTSTLSWVAPVKHLVPDIKKEPTIREQSLEKIRSDCLDIAAQLQSKKIRPETSTSPQKQQGNAHEQGLHHNLLPRPEFFHALLESKHAEELILRIEEIAKAPESNFVKKEIETVARALRIMLPVFAKMNAWETSSDDPKSHTDEGMRERKILRNSLIDEIIRVCAKMKTESEITKPEKKEDPKAAKSKQPEAKKEVKSKGKDSKEKPVENSSQTDRRRGPEYDIDDSFGGALLGEELENEMARVRQTLQAMLLRKKELDIAIFEEVRRKKMTSLQDMGIQTEPAVFLGDHIRKKISEFLGIEIKDAAEFGRMQEQSYYGGRIVLTDPDALPDADQKVLKLDMVSARAALVAAQKAHHLVDAILVKEQLQAAGEAEDHLSDAERQQRHRAAALGARLSRLTAYLARVEERGLRLAKGLLEIGRVQMLGAVRGEYLGDSGGAQNTTALARRAYEQLLESGRRRAEEERAQQWHDAAGQAARARILSGRLVAEAEGLLGAAGRELEEQRPLDALVSIRCAEAKIGRAVAAEPAP